MTIYTRKTTDTHEILTVARAAEIGADDDGGKWITYCEAHDTLINSDTRALAMDTRGIDFCDDCRDAKRADDARAAAVAETFATMQAATAADAAARAARESVMALRVRYSELHDRRLALLTELATIDREIVETREARDAAGLAYNDAKRDARDADDAHRVLPCGCYADSPMGHTCASGGSWESRR